MSKESYLELTRIISPLIEKIDTNMRECVSAEERILITLRYLATGETFMSVSLYFARGESTVRKIIKESTEIIWNALKDIYMTIPTREQFKHIADRFELLWNLPNCIGALDGKHIRIEKFPNTGTENFNYKHFHSTVLLACCDADGLFTIIEPGFAGRNSDGGIFKASAMNYWLTHGGFDIPLLSPLGYDETDSLFPYYFVADEAFPLSRNLLRPYSSRPLDNVKRIFNYRLNRGSKTIECEFGMAAEKFAVLNGPIRCRDPTTVNNIIRAPSILHNFVRKGEGIQYYPQGEIYEIVEKPNNIETQDLVIHEASSVTNLRNYLANYFLSPRTCLPWQWKFAEPGNNMK
nr:protein ALP1-like isoform X1 [Leptinotarsa decemlineata]